MEPANLQAFVTRASDSELYVHRSCICICIIDEHVAKLYLTATRVPVIKKKRKKEEKSCSKEISLVFPFSFSISPLYIDDIFFYGKSKVDVYVYVYVYIAFQIFDRLMGGLFKMGEFYRTWLDFLRVNFLYNFSSRHIFNLLKSYYGPLFSFFFFFSNSATLHCQFNFYSGHCVYFP